MQPSSCFMTGPPTSARAIDHLSCPIHSPCHASHVFMHPLTPVVVHSLALDDLSSHAGTHALEPLPVRALIVRGLHACMCMNKA